MALSQVHFIAGFLLFFPLAGRGQSASAGNADTNARVVLSGSTNLLAAWQKRLTLGPGDVFTIRLFNQPETADELFVGPDGRVNYLEATDVMASDLTVDELREELERRLTKAGRLAPRVVINPTAYRSKKYYVLGNTVQKGFFLLDKPMTIVEAVARARGFVTGGEGRNLRSQINFGRSFLVRKNEGGTFSPVPIDFEALFLNGELALNQKLAPDDYLYFAPSTVQDIFVLGEVAAPGILAFVKGLTPLQVIAKRGGFTEGAFRQRILLVRGSLKYPETFVINAKDVLSARKAEVELQAGDILFIAKKPWARAEELLDTALRGFIDAAVITWTGQNVEPLIK